MENHTIGEARVAFLAAYPKATRVSLTKTDAPGRKPAYSVEAKVGGVMVEASGRSWDAAFRAFERKAKLGAKPSRSAP